MSSIEANETVGQMAVRLPAASRVFARHNIDFCCGGAKPLAEVCAAKGLDPAALLAEIEAERPTSDDVRWDEAELADLIDHILVRFHRPLDEELPRLEAMARRVRDVHGDEYERLERLNTVVYGLVAELKDHMHKEEQILFPWIRSGDGDTAQGPIQVMLMDHDQAAVALEQIRELTDDFAVPEGACNTWTALWLGLKQFDRELRDHIHLENNVLFPRALNGE